MNSLQRLASLPRLSNAIYKLPLEVMKNHSGRSTCYKNLTTKSTSLSGGHDEWNDAWESSWLPEDLCAKNQSPWENDGISTSNSTTLMSSDVDAETKAFVEDMNENWNERRKGGKPEKNREQKEGEGEGVGGSLYSLENMKKDYRLKKQRIHAGLWVKEIEKQEEAKLVDSITGGGHDIEKLLDSCSEMFDSVGDDLNNSKIPSSSEFKYKPEGWETTSKTPNGNVWEMSQSEEDILLQEYDRRIAYNKFQIASFIKTHIFSRRRPIDGWKYMIEELGPNAKKGKGSVSRIPTLSDPSTQPFKEEKTPISSSLTSFRGR